MKNLTILIITIFLSFDSSSLEYRVTELIDEHYMKPDAIIPPENDISVFFGIGSLQISSPYCGNSFISYKHELAFAINTYVHLITTIEYGEIHDNYKMSSTTFNVDKLLIYRTQEAKETGYIKYLYLFLSDINNAPRSAIIKVENNFKTICKYGDDLLLIAYTIEHESLLVTYSYNKSYSIYRYHLAAN